MAGAVRIKHSGTNITTDIIQGLQELTAAELKVRTAQIITTEFAGTTGVASLRVDTTGAPTNFTSVGTFVDTVRDDAVGTHPTDGATTAVNTYTFSQGSSTATDGKTAIPLRFTSEELEQASDAEIDSDILDHVIAGMVAQGANVCGQYYIAASAPSGGTWTDRGSIVDTQNDGSGTTTKKLWQKTAPTTVPGDNEFRTLTKMADDNSVQEMTESEVASLVGRFRNRIMSNNIGKYEVSTAAPTSGGTWQQQGETLTDQVKDTATYAYEGSYTGSYTGTYDGTYTGYYDGTYNGSYAANYSGFAGTSYTGSYTGNYTGTYTGSYDGSFSGDFTGYYDGVTIISTSTTASSKKLFLRIA